MRADEKEINEPCYQFFVVVVVFFLVEYLLFWSYLL